ncbi:MAG: hypothetical protein KME12_23440 [Trichocoleus desertorum ATA4-8-CV12]|jgi:hypothetical protein|nr:hypothetical protein [Trichocoleus desertorum ATA4-8-CV12]
MTSKYPQPQFRLFHRVIHTGSSDAGTMQSAGTIYGIVHNPEHHQPGFWYYIHFDDGINDTDLEANLTALD